MTEPHGTARPTLAFAASLAAVLAALGAGTASAQVISATATSTPEFATFPRTESAEFRLQLVTGAKPAEPTVRFLIPLVGHGRAGWTLYVGGVSLKGPGQVRLGPPLLGHSPEELCERGYPGRAGEAHLFLPANSTSTLVVPADLTDEAPWEDTSYRLGFAVAGRRVHAPGPITRGPYGLRVGIHLRTPRGEQPEPEGFGDVVLGESVRVFGSTRPRLRNTPIILRFASSRVVRRRVRTDSLGRYSYRWTPGRADLFSVRALFRPPAGGTRVKDESCQRGIRVIESWPPGFDR